MESSRRGDSAGEPELIPCTRMSHYPKMVWHVLGAPISKAAATVVESAGRCVETVEKNLTLKPSRYPVIIKLRAYEAHQFADAREFVAKNSLAYGVPGAKIKPPLFSELPNGSYLVSIVMARLSGQPLDKLLFEQPEYNKKRKLTISALVRLELMLDMAFSLEAVHACGIVHRDITAANVMVDLKARKATIFDFDHAKFVETVDDPNRIEGTPFFMSHEAFSCLLTTYKTDVRGLAWIWYMLLDGVLPEVRTIEDARLYALSFVVKGLFTTIEQELSQSEREQLTELLISMFKTNQEDRCDLSHCIRVVEPILLRFRLDQMLPSNREAYYKAYCLGRDVRFILVKEAFEKRVGSDPTSDILALFEVALARLPNPADAPAALFVFLSALRVNLLEGLSSPEAVMLKVKETLTSFSQHHNDLQKLKIDAELCCGFLVRHKNEREITGLVGLIESINHLFKYSSCFSWTLDNLANFGRKFAKKCAEGAPVVAAAKVEMENERVRSRQQRIRQRFHLMPAPAPNQSRSSTDAPPAKRARFQ